jgi:hypothetical protein
MTYSKSSSEKFTLIDDLLDLDGPEVDETQNIGKGNIPKAQADQIKKFIRKPHISQYQEQQNSQRAMPPIMNSMLPPINGDIPMNGYGPPPNTLEMSGYGPMLNPIIPPYGYGPPNSNDGNMPMIQEGYTTPQPYNIPSNSPYSCLDVAGHIENCPICSKFYNNDKSVYIIAIVILLIMSIILLKKVLDNQ